MYRNHSITDVFCIYEWAVDKHRETNRGRDIFRAKSDCADGKYWGAGDRHAQHRCIPPCRDKADDSVIRAGTETVEYDRGGVHSNCVNVPLYCAILYTSC